MHFTVVTLMTVLLLHAFQDTTLTTGPEQCPFWKNIVNSRGFRELLLSVASSACLEIVLPPEFGVEEIRLLTQLLKVLPTSQKIISEIRSACNLLTCDAVESRHVALHLFCRANAAYVNLLPHPYWAIISTEPSNLRELSFSSGHFFLEGESNLEKLRRGADFHIVVHDQEILMAGSYVVRCLNCSPHDQRDFPVRLTKQIPIWGREITIACSEPLICQSPSFRTLTDILLHNNCSLHIKQMSFTQAFIHYLPKHMFDPGTIFYSTFALFRDIFFPTISTLFYFDRAGFAMYVRALEPLPKEAVLFLPFDILVWVLLLACIILCLMISFFAAYSVRRTIPGYQAVAAPFVASLVQQGYTGPSQADTLYSFRILFGVWSLMVTVLATGYKGVITSLFYRVPLGGKLLHYASWADLETRAPGVCLLNYPEQGMLDLVARFGHEKDIKNVTLFDCSDKSGNLKVTDSTHTLVVFRPSSDKAARLKDELSRIGFVQTDTIFSPVITGPQIRSNSPYFNSINKLLGRAFEAGLFEREEEIAEFEGRFRREFKYDRPSGTGDVALELSDLRPCFVVWAVGVVISSLAFVVSHVIARFHPPRIRMTRHTVRQS